MTTSVFKTYWAKAAPLKQQIVTLTPMLKIKGTYGRNSTVTVFQEKNTKHHT